MKSTMIFVTCSLLLSIGQAYACTVPCEPQMKQSTCIQGPTTFSSEPAPFNPRDVGVVSTDSSHCYTFENLASEAKYNVGDVLDARNGRIKLFDYMINGGPPLTDANFANVKQSPIPGGDGQSLWVKAVNPQVKLDVPATRVRMLVAENRSGTGPHHNIGVNGRRLVIDGSLENAHGRIIGPRRGTRVRVDVAMEPEDTSVAWRKGILQLEVVSGKINKFAVGSLNAYYDEICVTE